MLSALSVAEERLEGKEKNLKNYAPLNFLIIVLVDLFHVYLRRRTYTLLLYATNKCFEGADFGIIYGAVQLSLPLAGIGADLLSQFIPPYLGYEILFIVVASLLFLSFMLTTIIKLSKYGTSSSMSAQQQ
ncbi:hypothetical protein Tcan_15263 [Toxocara canis]|uniref:Uncharacterized protein n=1 Tax=Toxocara canis TaxID=6265 RepID=A0A0B2VK25_TOXCA|nr:hypothetical protein Tcan_15263 [Toxocara canis]